MNRKIEHIIAEERAQQNFNMVMDGVLGTIAAVCGVALAWLAHFI